MWWDHDFGWGGWIIMAVGMSGFWILLAVLVVALLRSSRPSEPGSPDARDLLDQRLARGEIEVEEYQARLQALGRAPR